MSFLRNFKLKATKCYCTPTTMAEFQKKTISILARKNSARTCIPGGSAKWFCQFVEHFDNIFQSEIKSYYIKKFEHLASR